MDEQMKLALAEAARNIGQPSAAGAPAFAQIITESIEPNHLSLSILNTFMNTRSLQMGDQLAVRVRKGLPVRTFVPFI